jgi:hypothetical protein
MISGAFYRPSQKAVSVFDRPFQFLFSGSYYDSPTSTNSLPAYLV